MKKKDARRRLQMKGSLLDEVKVDKNGKHYLPTQDANQPSGNKRNSITELVQSTVTTKISDMFNTI